MQRASALLLGGLLTAAQCARSPATEPERKPNAALSIASPVASNAADATAHAETSGDAAAPRAIASAPSAPSDVRTPSAASSNTTPEATADVSALRGGPGAVRGEHGAVTSVEAHATRAGIAMLEQGGNAVDAAVATAYALAVTHPSAGNLGGGGFMLIRPPGGPTYALDFRESAPAALTRDRFDAMERAGGLGPVSVGVPGSVAGLELAHDRFGKLSRAAVLAPAITLAHGYAFGAHQAALLAGSFRALSHDRAARAIFSHDKKPYGAGERLVQRDLQHTLELIAERGRGGFYAGQTAQALSALHGGLISEQDLAHYQAKWREPLRFDYRGLTVEVMPAPSAGGVAVTEELLMLQALHAASLPPDSAAELHLFLEASRRAQAERRFGVVDPDALTPAENARKRARFLDPNTWLRQAPIDPAHATPSEQIHPLSGDGLHEFEHTTHLSVVDGDGMVVSLTTTLSASYGSKLVAPGTGVVLNNAVASFSASGENQPVGGRRTVSSMAPTLVLQGNSPLLVLGTPGGDTIPSTIVQVLRHLVDHGESLTQAVDAPRLHQGFIPDEVRYEPRNAPPAAVLNALRKLGHRVKKGHSAIGDANAILIRSGVAYAYADPRELGTALAARAAPATR